jgi:formylglycine-generating enzyme required for sulfatase activity
MPQWRMFRPLSSRHLEAQALQIVRDRLNGAAAMLLLLGDWFVRSALQVVCSVARSAAVLCFSLGAIVTSAHAQTTVESRFALVIANRNYQDVSTPLPHTVNDARALSVELRQRGFIVDVAENLNREGMLSAIEAFRQKLTPGSTALFSFGGFAIQLAQQNYLIPTAAQIWSEADLRREGVPLEAVFSAMQSKGPSVKIIVLDASRRTPYERRFRTSWDGLAPIEILERTLAITSASPGRTVVDTGGENSLFMDELLKQLRVPGLSAEDVFRTTRINVARASSGERVPRETSTMMEDFSFTKSAPAAPPAPVTGAPTPPPVATVPAAPPPVAATPAPPPVARAPAPPPVATAPASPPVPTAPARPPVATAPAPPPVATAPAPPPLASGPAPAASAPSTDKTTVLFTADLKPGTNFRDCEECPELTVLPPGEFRMGSTEFDFEKPERVVTLPKSFAIGRREVRFAEWDACIAAGGCKYRPDDLSKGRGDRPATNVSWEDVKVYLAWLSQKTGEKYRLPSEAEWEYAARGGTTSRYWWGNEPGGDHANCRDCGGASVRQTLPAGTFAANKFGLFDTSGNAAEWVEDCWNDSFRGAPKDSSAWTAGACHQRVLRGGSFDSVSRYVRSASRFRYDADVRFYGNGFRVVRELK